MDGDLRHPPETLALLIEALEKQVGISGSGSRYVRGGGVSESEYLTARISWGLPCCLVDAPGTLATVRDPMSGYFAIRRSVIEGCTLKPEATRFSGSVGRGWHQTVVEVPHIFIERQQGRSKLGLRQYQSLSRTYFA